MFRDVQQLDIGADMAVFPRMAGLTGRGVRRLLERRSKLWRKGYISCSTFIQNQLII